MLLLGKKATLLSRAVLALDGDEYALDEPRKGELRARGGPPQINPWHAVTFYDKERRVEG